ncbi:glutamine cyclotransferase, partial [hydrothermal vent metagenome]
FVMPTLIPDIILQCIILQLLFILLFFPVAGLASQQAGQSMPQIDTCNAQNVFRQQQNAPGHLIKFNTDSIPRYLAEHSVGPPAREYLYKVIRRMPHSTRAFTQGLAFYDNYLFEGTGLLGQSEIRKLETETGRLLISKKTDSLAFGEGISIKNDRLIQLSWKSERAYLYDVETFELLKEIKYSGEGWGVTHIDDKILISDGSSLIRGHNVARFFMADESSQLSNQIKRAVSNVVDAPENTVKNIHVNESGVEVRGINELEYANGFIYANVWPTDCIAEIDPDTGNINAWINLRNLNPAKSVTDWNAVLNGIAYQQDKNVFYVTGKYWPYIYVIALQRPEKGRSEKGRPEKTRPEKRQSDKTQSDKTQPDKTEEQNKAVQHDVYVSL